MRLTYASLKIEADKIQHRNLHPLIKRVHQQWIYYIVHVIYSLRYIKQMHDF